MITSFSMSVNAHIRSSEEGSSLMPSRSLPYPVFDIDNHMYETTDALTKYLPKEHQG
jgi:hypothetical protein